MNAKPTAPKTTLHRCECSKWEFGTTVDLADGDVDFVATGTDCHRSTHRTFAQGHDAKLVGFLVRAELDGLEIKTDSMIYGSAVNAAYSISEALGVKAANMLEAARRRAAEKAIKGLAKKAKSEVKAAEATEVVAPEPAAAPVVQEPRAARIKVGRWTYDAMISPSGSAQYTTKLGKSMVAGSEMYTEV